MNRRARNTINWLIIAMMVVLPVRAVNAFAQFACETPEQAAEVMHDHSMHMMQETRTQHEMHVMPETVQTDSAACCCCDGDVSCSGDCAAGAGASFVMPAMIRVPVVHGSEIRTHVAVDPLSRDQSPPTRPPASLLT